MYNDFTDTVSAGPKGGRLKETKCQESSKPLGQVEDEIMKTGAQFVGEEILKKIQKKKKLKRKDLIPVLLSPLMGGKSEIKTRILEGIKAVNREDKLISIEEAKKMEAMLYALANKLLSRADLEKIKEEVKMTILGEMLRDDFMEEGRQETQERYNRLILCLDKDGKTSLIVKAASDPQLLEKLFQEYGI